MKVLDHPNIGECSFFFFCWKCLHRLLAYWHAICMYNKDRKEQDFVTEAYCCLYGLESRMAIK